jgi:Trypsin
MLSVSINFSCATVMKFIFISFLIISAAKFENFEITEDEIWAKSPMESQFNLRIMQDNFQGLYDDVFAGIEGRIAGGKPANEKQFPYQALMYMVDDDGSTFICGGALLTFNWVLTVN